MDILLIEDDPRVADFLRRGLSAEGYGVRHCACGTSGLEAAQEFARACALSGQPGVILLDVMLPGIDGFEVLRTIKSNADTASIPVMMLTGRKLEADVVSGLNLGADEYVVKPFMMEELLVRLRRLLERSARGRS